MLHTRLFQLFNGPSFLYYSLHNDNECTKWLETCRKLLKDVFGAIHKNRDMHCFGVHSPKCGGNFLKRIVLIHYYYGPARISNKGPVLHSELNRTLYVLTFQLVSVHAKLVSPCLP